MDRLARSCQSQLYRRSRRSPFARCNHRPQLTARLSSCSSSRSRPVNPASRSRGSCAGTQLPRCAPLGSSLDAAGDACCVPPGITASTSCAGVDAASARRATAMNTRRPRRFRSVPGRQPATTGRGVLAGCLVDAPLQVTDRPRADACRLGQFLLRQLGFASQSPCSSPANPSAGCCSTSLSATGEILAPNARYPSIRREGYECRDYPAQAASCQPLRRSTWPERAPESLTRSCGSSCGPACVVITRAVGHCGTIRRQGECPAGSEHTRLATAEIRKKKHAAPAEA